MNICKAVGLRISNLLAKKKMTLYRLEQKSGILHGTMMCIMNERNKNITLKTIFQLARGFDMTLKAKMVLACGQLVMMVIGI